MKTRIILFSLLIYISCDPDVKPIKFQNKSSSIILIEYSKLFPDTTIFKGSSGSDEILPGQSEVSYIDGTWEDAFRSNSYQTLFFFVWDADTLIKYGAQKCRQDYRIMKRYQYSLLDMDSLDWTITYP